MTKTRLVKKAKKTAGTFLRLEPEFKKKIQIYAIEQGLSLTDLFINSVNEKMNK
tara:strand:- start:8261 stop:8422 length:162 start_codon:yes stop_codon:yes gene_type:complete